MLMTFILTLKKNTKATCCADDIAIWHTGRDIVDSKMILQKSPHRNWKVDIEPKAKTQCWENHIYCLYNRLKTQEFITGEAFHRQYTHKENIISNLPDNHFGHRIKVWAC